MILSFKQQLLRDKNYEVQLPWHLSQDLWWALRFFHVAIYLIISDGKILVVSFRRVVDQGAVGSRGGVHLKRNHGSETWVAIGEFWETLVLNSSTKFRGCLLW